MDRLKNRGVARNSPEKKTPGGKKSKLNFLNRKRSIFQLFPRRACRTPLLYPHQLYLSVNYTPEIARRNFYIYREFITS